MYFLCKAPLGRSAAPVARSNWALVYQCQSPATGVKRLPLRQRDCLGNCGHARTSQPNSETGARGRNTEMDNRHHPSTCPEGAQLQVEVAADKKTNINVRALDTF